MKKQIPIALFVFVVLLTACKSIPPQIDLEFTKFDFGVVINGEIVTQEVRVSNIGGEELVISQVLTTCGCTTATLDLRVIPAGKEGKLQVTFDSGAHGPYLEGEVIRRVILVTNDPNHYEATVDFVANISLPETP
ncbi:MAG: DUF1573 domain-containing protein [Anaerolineales bacterium]|nr:DUF1573 domain-containing protein [Chloroflexota bacterium]MBL6980341.1 DUF1573 domain-containing protein [Anaerolineales bacterium]